MRRILLGAIVGLLLLGGADITAYAHGGHGGGHGGGSRSGGHGRGVGNGGRGSGYRNGHGKRGGRKLARGYRGWSRRCWFPRYGCYGFFCPDDGCWYYWYGPGNCYLPVSNMAASPPDDSVNAPPDLPPGATEGP